MTPSGNDSDAAHAVFSNLYAHYLGSIPVHRTEILWIDPIWIALYGVVLIVLLFLLSFSLRHVGARKNKLLELTAFAGHLTERVGGLAFFSVVVWTIVVLWAAYFAVKHILYGLIY